MSGAPKDRAPARPVEKAIAAWGEPLPDWVDVLARACAADSQAAVARRLGYSGALVSNVLAAKYKADLASVETVVRGVLMAATVVCPVVGDLATDQCLGHQRAPWAPHNPQRIAFYRACRAGCPNSRIGGGHAE
jgi:hypothetical protein